MHIIKECVLYLYTYVISDVSVINDAALGLMSYYLFQVNVITGT